MRGVGNEAQLPERGDLRHRRQRPHARITHVVHRKVERAQVTQSFGAGQRFGAFGGWRRVCRTECELTKRRLDLFDHASHEVALISAKPELSQPPRPVFSQQHVVAALERTPMGKSGESTCRRSR